tara:strand:- start:218 stop:1405 length:1188 start_codon:yes stop_codon:yes gene_type:complete
MAATEKGVWNLQEVRDKQLASEWAYDAPSSSFNQTWTTGASAMLGVSLSGPASRSSPVQVPGTSWGGPSSLASIKLSTGVGELFRMWLKNDGTIWGAGSGRKLGQNNPTTYSSPKQLGTGTDWRSLSTSWAQTVAVKTDGTMYSWGEQSYGELGQNNNTVYSSPRQIPGTTWGEWVSTASGYNVSMNIKTDGTLWAWGGNNWGGLGQNDRTNRSSPVQIPGTWSDPKDMASKSVIKSDGTLWSWGYNRWGQLGLNESSAPSFTKHRSSPTQLPGTTWSKVSRTFSNQFGIKTDGTLWVMGKNDYGQMGQGDDINRSSPTQITGTWKNIVSGGTPGSSVLGVKTDGTLWVWGNASNQGAMGNNTRNIDYSSPVQLPGNWSDVGAINGYGLTAFRGV